MTSCPCFFWGRRVFSTAWSSPTPTVRQKDTETASRSKGMKELGYIYKIENTVNGKVYVGQSKDPKRRWKDHLNVSQNSKDGQYDKPFYVDIRRYGKENFKLFVLEECRDQDMSAREVFWIEKLNAQDKNKGYNIYGGGRGKGFFVSRAVDQYDLDGNYIATYQNQCEAARAIGVHSTSLGKACNGVRRHKSCGGYMWRYHGDKAPKRYSASPGYIKAVMQYDMNGRIVNQYNSLKDAGKKLGVRYQDISECCHGIRESCAGYLWRFA